MGVNAQKPFFADCEASKNRWNFLVQKSGINSKQAMTSLRKMAEL